MKPIYWLGLLLCTFGAQAVANGMITVHPQPLDTILTNPGIGVETFQDNWGMPLQTPEQYPATTVDYYRFYWDELEPQEGQINFAMLDSIIAKAKAQTPSKQIALRVMDLDEPTSGSKLPRWLIDKPIRGNWTADKSTFVPDYADPVFQQYAAKLLNALGARYNGNPQLAYIDIGVVGSWGEWHLSNFPQEEPLAQRYTPEQLNAYVDMHLKAFPDTPKIMLINEPNSFAYALKRGTGWRADCLGDWHNFSDTWSHMRDEYPQRLQQAAAEGAPVDSAWQHAPVSFEVCGKMSQWQTIQHYTRAEVQATFDWALAQHMSTLNLKSDPIPAEYRDIVDNALKKMGYRISLQSLTHPASIAPGRTLTLTGEWRNEGVAPAYVHYPLNYRLVGAKGNVIKQWTSRSDIRQWLPGEHQTQDSITLPKKIPVGNYALELTFTNAYQKPALNLANEGKQASGWYRVSQIEIQ